jgi:hypothetical protein
MDLANEPRFTVNGRYIFICFAAVLLSFFFHEFAHWLAGEELGYNMGMSLNSTYPVGSSEVLLKDAMIISAAGPAFTIIQAIVCYLLLRHPGRTKLYPFLFIALYMRLLATVMRFKHPNDEARISRDLGIGTFTIPILISSFLFYLVYNISRRKDLSTKINLQTIGLILLFSSMLILADQFLKVRII